MIPSNEQDGTCFAKTLNADSLFSLKFQGSPISYRSHNLKSFSQLAMVLKIGIIGYGYSAKIFHIPFIQTLPQFELAAIVQRNPKAENDAAKDFPGVQIFNSVEALLENDAIDIALVTTPADSHFSLTKAALKSKKHGQLY